MLWHYVLAVCLHIFSQTTPSVQATLFLLSGEARVLKVPRTASCA